MTTASGKIQSTKKTPAAEGFAMPAEWAKQDAIWLSWPTNPITWPDFRMAEVRDSYLKMIEALLPGEQVKLLVDDVKTQDTVRELLQKRGVNDKNLLTFIKPTVDGWIRDYGPTFVTNKKGQKSFVKWIFNAWGGKYSDLAQDTKVFDQAKELVPYDYFEPGIVLEGGSIEVNGLGTCLTTEQCLLNKNRNSHLSKQQIEQLLKDYLNVSNIVWLKEGIVGDDTDGHIDDIARFVNENTILATFEDDTSDENYPLLKENWELLEKARNEKGNPWNVVKLPMPRPIIDDGVRLPASYANFLIANQVVLLPIFRQLGDDAAIGIMRDLFPKHRIVPIDCRSMVYGLGAVHCLSQQEPSI